MLRTEKTPVIAPQSCNTNGSGRSKAIGALIVNWSNLCWIPTMNIPTKSQKMSSLRTTISTLVRAITSAKSGFAYGYQGNGIVLLEKLYLHFGTLLQASCVTMAAVDLASTLPLCIICHWAMNSMLLWQRLITPSCLLNLDRLAKSHLCYHDNGLFTADNHLEFTSLSWQRIFSFRWCLVTNLTTTCDTLRRFPCATMATNSSPPTCVSSQQTEFSHLQNGHCTYRWFHD